MRAPRAAMLPVAAVASLESPRGCRLRTPARERARSPLTGYHSDFVGNFVPGRG